MKYAIIQCVNGSYKVVAEGITNLDRAKVTYHGTCQNLWNASDVITGSVRIVDENLDCVQDYKEFIHHDAVVTEGE